VRFDRLPASSLDRLSRTATRGGARRRHNRLHRDPAKVSVDGETGELRVSKIFDWFRTDFDRPPAGDLPDPDTESYGKNAGVVRWLAAYGPPRLRARIDRGPFRLEHLPYDWHLNEQPPAASPGER